MNSGQHKEWELKLPYGLESPMGKAFPMNAVGSESLCYILSHLHDVAAANLSQKNKDQDGLEARQCVGRQILQ